MSDKKQSRLDNLEKRMAAVTNVIQQLINEISYLKDLSIGTLETIKRNFYLGSRLSMSMPQLGRNG